MNFIQYNYLIIVTSLKLRDHIQTLDVLSLEMTLRICDNDLSKYLRREEMKKPLSAFIVFIVLTFG